MGVFNGTDGDVTFSDGYNVNPKAFEMTPECTIGKSLNFDSDGNWEVALAGAKRWTGTITWEMDDGTAVPTVGATGSATFQAKSGYTWSGTIMIGQYTSRVELENADAVELQATFTGSGTLTSPS